MKKAIVFQMIILIVAWIVMTPDVAQDNTHLFGLVGDVEIVRGNSIWVMLGTAVLSVLNVWFWWPKKVKVNTPETTKEDTKSAETEEAKDPVVPKMD